MLLCPKVHSLNQRGNFNCIMIRLRSFHQTTEKETETVSIVKQFFVHVDFLWESLDTSCTWFPTSTTSFSTLVLVLVLFTKENNSTSLVLSTRTMLYLQEAFMCL